MEENQYPEYFYINADRTVLCSVDNEITRADFGELTPIKLEVAKALFSDRVTYPKPSTPAIPNPVYGCVVIPFTPPRYTYLDQVVEKTWSLLNRKFRYEDQFRFLVRAATFKSLVLSEEGGEIIDSEEFNAAKKQFLSTEEEAVKKNWYILGNWMLGEVMRIYRMNHPERTDLAEPI